MKEIDWKCGKCGKEYTFEEMMLLDKAKCVESDTNPKKQHGFISVCGCGYKFHVDKWRLSTDVSLEIEPIGKTKGRVSTVYLGLNHFGFWYETMIFLDSSSCYFQDRYKTKAEAKKGHNKILRMIKNKEYTYDNEDEVIVINEVGE